MILFNNQQIPIGNFPNGEIHISKPFFERHKEDIRNVVTLKYESDADLFHLFLIRKAIWFPCDLRITYFPYSRMDRKSDAYVFTLKSVAKFINSMEWDNVIIYEPHSDVTPALLNRCKVVEVVNHPYFRARINMRVGSDYQIFYPDAGAQKRYADGGQKTAMSGWQYDNQLVGFKHRDFSSGKIMGLHILGEQIREQVVILDDLCSKGGTFILAAKKLKEMGFKKVHLAVGHCEKTIFEGEIFKTDLISEVFTTDSILDNGHDKLMEGMLHVIPLGLFHGEA